MATLRYAGVAIEVLPGQGTRTLNIIESAKYSDDGIDYKWHEIIIEAQGIVNPSVIAVTPGATSGNTLWALQNQLKAPRQELTLDIAADRVIQAPPRLVQFGNLAGTQITMTAIAAALAAGVALPGILAGSDCDGGPFPEELKIIEVQGIKSVLIYFRVRCTINLCNNIVLTNRWSIHHHIDELHYTTRTVEGTMTLRRDLLDFAGAFAALALTPDSFRSSLMISCPTNMQRESVDVRQGSDAYTLDYTVVDKERPLNSATGFPALRIEGNATSGYQTDIHAFIADTLHSLPSLPRRVLMGNFDYLGTLEKATRAMIPIPMSNALVRVYGDRTSSKLDLASIALNVIIDRFTVAGAPRGTTLIGVVSCYLTQDIENRMVELRMELIPLPVKYGAFNSFSGAAIICQGGMMDLTRQINLPAPWVNLVGTDGPNPIFPGSGQTVGTFIGSMIAQVLGTTCTVTPTPPANASRIDQGLG